MTRQGINQSHGNHSLSNMLVAELTFCYCNNKYVRTGKIEIKELNFSFPLSFMSYFYSGILQIF